MSMDQMYTDCLKELEAVKAERDEAFSRGKQAFNDLLRVEAERDALAAHVERVKYLRGRYESTPYHSDEEIGALDDVGDIIGRAPATSLARRDARMKAEAMDDLAASELVGELHKEFIRRCASEYRRQAGGV